jgi:hypothetical protein
MTSSHGNLAGLYYLPWAYAEHDTGLTTVEIQAARQALEQLDFIVYDDEGEWIWVVNGYFHQCATEAGKLPSKADDKRLVGALAIVREAPSKLQAGFARRYGGPFEAPSKPLRSPFEAPSGTETETETRDRDTQTDASAGAPARVCGPSAPARDEPDQPTDTAGEAWNDWRGAWGLNPRRRVLPLTPINGDLPKLAEMAKRYPNPGHRRALLAAYFASQHKPLLEKPYSIGMFLYWATWLDDHEPIRRQTPSAGEPSTWDRILERLSLQMNQLMLQRWFPPLRVVQETESDLLVSAGEAAAFIERNFRGALDQASEDVRPGLRVRLADSEPAQGRRLTRTA